MAKMTRDEAIKNVTAYVYMECLNMPKDVIRALDVLKDSAMAWDKVKAEILKEEKRTAEVGIKFGIGLALGIIDKHLGELQQED